MKQERTAIVTGGLQGIGLAIAADLAAQGISVAVGARRGADATLAARAMETIGDDCLVEALDVRSSESIETFVASVRETLGTPDILVNAAGVTIHQTVVGHSDEDWQDTIDINLTGPFRMIRACLPEMKKAAGEESSTSPLPPPTPLRRPIPPTAPRKPACSD